MATDTIESTLGAIGAAGELPQVKYTVEINGTPSAWRVRRVELLEAVSELYECVLDLANDNLGVDVAALEGASCVLRIERGSRPTTRRCCGVVFRVQWLGTLIDHQLVRIHVRPALAALGQVRDSRIFQEQSVKEVLQKVLTDGLQPYERTVRLELDRTYQKREYCTQYGESDLDFALRLMSEEGIFFYFDHSGQQEAMVLVDLNKKCPDLAPGGGAVQVVGSEAPQELLPAETIGRLSVGRELRSTGVVLRDFDWTRPGLDLTALKGAPDRSGTERNVYEYIHSVIADYDEGNKAYAREEGALRAKLLKENLDLGTRFAEGESNLTVLTPGRRLEVDGQHLAELGTEFLVTRVVHLGDASEEVQHKWDGALAQRYQNRFTCTAFDLQFRPPLRQRPVIAGPQTATVVGPAGEEVYTDPHGRIKVQFHWDRQGKRSEKSSCWVRVMQSWAGGGFGSVFLPRIGMEVVIQFLDGDPDRPLVVGCVYNGVNPPSLNLPQDKTKSTIMTRSSPGGNGFNELTFEDAAGSELISLHGQKDLHGKILHDQSYEVDHDDSTTVGHDQTVKVGHDQKIEVGNDRTLQVGNDETITIGKQESLTVGTDRKKTIGKSETNTVGTSRTTSVGGADSLSVGGSQSITVARRKTESVALLSMEQVGGAKMLSVGGGYAITVGAGMNTGVGGVSFEEVGLVKTVVAGVKLEMKCGPTKIEAQKGGKLSLDGKELTVTAADKFSVNCGAAKLEMEKGGKIELSGTDVTIKAGGGTINIDAGGIITIKGPMVKINT